jgi:hypothetical protein
MWNVLISLTILSIELGEIFLSNAGVIIAINALLLLFFLGALLNPKFDCELKQANLENIDQQRMIGTRYFGSLWS